MPAHGKAYRLEHRVHLHLKSAAEAATLDDLLWTFRQGSFVPHEIRSSGATAESPVTIGHGETRPDGGDLLIELANDGSDISPGYQRIAELIDSSDAGKVVMENRLRLYRQHDIEPVTHNIESP